MRVVTLHNGWSGFLSSFMAQKDYQKKTIGINRYLKSGTTAEVYQFAEFDAQNLKKKILKALE
jgi:transketolase